MSLDVDNLVKLPHLALGPAGLCPVSVLAGAWTAHGSSAHLSFLPRDAKVHGVSHSRQLLLGNISPRFNCIENWGQTDTGQQELFGLLSNF